MSCRLVHFGGRPVLAPLGLGSNGSSTANTLTADDFAADPMRLLGVPVNDPAVTEFLTRLEPGRSVRRGLGDFLSWTSRKAGIEFNIETRWKRITTVYL